MKSIALPLTTVIIYSSLLILTAMLAAYGIYSARMLISSTEYEMVNAVLTLIDAMDTVYGRPGATIYVETYVRDYITIDTAEHTIAINGLVYGLEKVIQSHAPEVLDRIVYDTSLRRTKIVLNSNHIIIRLIRDGREYSHITVKGRIGFKITCKLIEESPREYSIGIRERDRRYTMVIEVVGGHVSRVY